MGHCTGDVPDLAQLATLRCRPCGIPGGSPTRSSSGVQTGHGSVSLFQRGHKPDGRSMWSDEA